MYQYKIIPTFQAKKMQSFCFFGTPKEVGVRGLVPENKKHKTEF
ncbi:hypothetical protein BPSP16_01730 [Brachyspira pilosicoli SP16]|nr:hypothetical protein BPSP16_01730 [Brachyspira pilosicoli SP16]